MGRACCFVERPGDEVQRLRREEVRAPARQPLPLPHVRTEPSQGRTAPRVCEAAQGRNHQEEARAEARPQEEVSTREKHYESIHWQ